MSCSQLLFVVSSYSLCLAPRACGSLEPLKIIAYNVITCFGRLIIWHNHLRIRRSAETRCLRASSSIIALIASLNFSKCSANLICSFMTSYKISYICILPIIVSILSSSILVCPFAGFSPAIDGCSTRGSANISDSCLPLEGGVAGVRCCSTNGNGTCTSLCPDGNRSLVNYSSAVVSFTEAIHAHVSYTPSL